MNEKAFDELEGIVARVRDGDDEAREELIQLSYERLKRLARKMLKQFPSVRRWEETDDVFQRAAMRLLESLKKVQPEDSRHFFNLAALQIRRELIEMARRINGPLGMNRNLESVAGPTKDDATPVANDPGTDTHEASSLATWTDFHESVDKLDEEERETFELIWYQGFSQEVVAKMLNTSQRTVSRRWQKARRSVFETLGRQLPE